MSPRSRKNRKHRRPAFRAAGKHRKPGDAHTIATFCAANQMSEAHYFALKRAGKGPREAKLGPKRIIITPEAEADWRREREAETMAKRQKVAKAAAAEVATV
jgi:hypothetical protein